MTTTKTMTAGQMAWALKKGFAWPERITEETWGDLGEVYWTSAGGYTWNVDRQLYEMF